MLGTIDRLDVILHAATSAGDRAQGLEKQLIVAIVAEIGGADSALLTYLARRELEELLAPLELLRAFALERKWVIKSSSKEWWTGKTYELDGVLVENSALLALEGQAEAIGRIIWKAEVGTLFPVIEYYRQF